MVPPPPRAVRAQVTRTTALPDAWKIRAESVGRPTLLVSALVVTVLVAAAPVVWSRANAHDATVAPLPASVTGAAGDGRLSPATCRRAVTSLLAQDVTRAATGRPDADVPVDTDAMAELGGRGTPATAQVQRIHDQLVGPATADVVNAYRQDASAALAAYQVRIGAACDRVAAP